jgi:hypothetical protein
MREPVHEKWVERKYQSVEWDGEARADRIVPAAGTAMPISRARARASLGPAREARRAQPGGMPRAYERG